MLWDINSSVEHLYWRTVLLFVVSLIIPMYEFKYNWSIFDEKNTIWIENLIENYRILEAADFTSP